MRIIAGKWKGRKLKSWKGKLPVRPMTDQVKETVFNVLIPYLFEDCKVLDLFSGTGSLALEALSRGASLAHVVENHSACINLIKKNKEFLTNEKKLWIHKKNVFSFLKQNQKSQLLSKKNRREIPVFDIVLVDPPFPLKAGDSLMESLSKSELVHKETVIVIETGAGELLKNRYFDFYLFSKKDFNDKKIWFYKAE